LRIANWKRKTALAGFLAVSGVAWAGAQQPAPAAPSALAAPAASNSSADIAQIQNAKLETRTLTTSLSQTLQQLIDRADKAQWIGYSVPEVSGQRTVCCGNYNGEENICRTCRLENENANGVTISGEKNRIIKLEGPRQLFVLYRLEAKHVTRIRLASDDCTLDFGGLSLVWLTGVKPSDSVQFLAGFTKNEDVDRHDIAEGALSAIAMHQDSSADRALESFTSPQQSEATRKQAAFWLGEARGQFGFATLKQMARSDPSSEVRSHVTFALSISSQPAAIDEMIRMAHDDSSTHVRGQALFWLAQKAGKKAIGAIDGAIADDPDTDVKKKAVFALSQLPKDDGVPKLIQVAQNNRNPEVRKQAMFWLGQSNDPRALQFFEKVLSQ
jgi:hypothetical protein